MLKFLSKVRIKFNALDPRTPTCMDFLAQCNARKAKESNPACQLLMKRQTDDHPPQIVVTYVNGVEEVIDATATFAHQAEHPQEGAAPRDGADVQGCRRALACHHS
ncbi:hypothetical protein ACLOJK_003089 [Asimina triloba]